MLVIVSGNYSHFCHCLLNHIVAYTIFFALIQVPLLHKMEKCLLSDLT